MNSTTSTHYNHCIMYLPSLIQPLQCRNYAVFQLFTLMLSEQFGPDQSVDEPPQPSSTQPRPDSLDIPDLRARLVLATPPPGHKATVHPPQEILINLVEHWVIAVELAGEWHVAAHHVGGIVHGECVGVLLWGLVPRNVVQVMVYGCGGEFRGVADDCLEVAFGGGDEVGVVHEECSWEVVPSPDAVLDELPR